MLSLIKIFEWMWKLTFPYFLWIFWFYLFFIKSKKRLIFIACFSVSFFQDWLLLWKKMYKFVHAFFNISRLYDHYSVYLNFKPLTQTLLSISYLFAFILYLYNCFYSLFIYFKFVWVYMDLIYLFFSIFCIIFFLFKVIYNWKTFFINYKLQKKQKNPPTTHFTRPSGYWKSIPFAYFCTYCVFIIVYQKFFPLFLTFAISLIKDFNVNDSDLLKL